MRLILASLAPLLLAGCGPTPPPAAAPLPARSPAAPSLTANTKFIDLTHPFDDQTIYWPTEEGFILERGKNGVTPSGYYYAANRFRAAEHGGTHLDAPIHFFADRHTADAIELERLIGAAAVIDVTEKCRADRDYEISTGDLRAWETTHARQLIDVIVLLRTGWSDRWPNRESYLGTSARGPAAVSELHFPGLAPEAARWLADHRAIKAIGIDTASIDFGQSTHFQSHVALCQHNIPIFENITSLDRLPSSGATAIALPMKIAGGSGGPLRIVAIVPGDSK